MYLLFTTLIINFEGNDQNGYKKKVRGRQGAKPLKWGSKL